MAKAKSQREVDICNFVTQIVKYSAEATRDDRNRWLLASNLFQGKQDYGALRESNPALSKVFVHEFSKLCRSVASASQDLIFQDPKFFDLLPPEGEEQDEFGRIVEKIVRYRIQTLNLENYTYDFCLTGGIYGLGINKLIVENKVVAKPEVVLKETEEQERKDLDNASVKVDRPEVQLPDNPNMVVDGILSGLDTILGTGKKVTREIEVKDSLEFGIKLRTVDPLNYFYETDCLNVNESPWDAERSWVKLYQLEPLFKAGILDKSKKDILKDTVARSSISSHITDDYTSNAMLRRDQTVRAQNYTPVVEIIEYFGPLLSTTGDVLEESCWFVVANGKVVLKDAKIPYWNRKSPYYKAVFSKVPFKAVGAGIADAAIDQQLLINNLFSLYLDHLAFTILGVKGVNVDSLKNPNQLQNGMTPGMIIQLIGNQKAGDVFTDLDYNEQLAFPVMQILEKLSLSGEAAAAVDAQNSNPSSRARISAREISANVDRSTRSQFSLARELDVNFIEETITRVLQFVLQYDFEKKNLMDLKMAGVITDSEYQALVNIPRIERFREINRPYKIKVKGFRERLERNDFLSRLSEYTQQVSQMASVNPAINEKVNFGEVIEIFTEAFRLPTEKIIYQATPQDKAREENQLLKLGQQVSILPEDMHDIHLPIHYDQLMKTQTESLISHCIGHIQILMQNGMNIPPPPPEVAVLLGLEPEEASTDSMIQ